MSKHVISIYLSGSIKKGASDTEKQCYWTESDEAALEAAFSDFDVVKILNPANAKVTRQDYYANFGCDVFLVSIADFVIADLRERRGIGIGSEMTIAKFYGIPVIALVTRNTHYRMDKLSDVCGEDLTNWIHPFAYGLSDVVVETLAEAIEWIKKHNAPPPPRSAERRTFQDAINYYLKVQGGL